MLVFWGLAAPIAALIGFPWTFITGDIRFLYWLFMIGCRIGVWLTGVKVRAVGLEKLDPALTYIFMSNHVSNLDPPIITPLIPKRTSVMLKKELLGYPILGRAMRMGSMVPVDRGNRNAGIESVRAAKEVVKQGLNMTIYVEGHRSFDGKLLPFKKGPFYLAMECGVPVVPVTIVGTHYIWPKGRFAIKPGVATVIFHPPIMPEDFGSRECLMEKVRAAIESGLPEELRQTSASMKETVQPEGPAKGLIGPLYLRRTVPMNPAAERFMSLLFPEAAQNGRFQPMGEHRSSGGGMARNYSFSTLPTRSWRSISRLLAMPCNSASRTNYFRRSAFSANTEPST